MGVIFVVVFDSVSFGVDEEEKNDPCEDKRITVQRWGILSDRIEGGNFWNRIGGCCVVEKGIL